MKKLIEEEMTYEQAFHKYQRLSKTKIIEILFGMIRVNKDLLNKPDPYKLPKREEALRSIAVSNSEQFKIAYMNCYDWIENQI